MFNNTSGIIKIILSALFFPMYFQEVFLRFAWGAGDPLWLLTAKRILVLLPAGVILLSCWASIACVLTVPIRQKRQEYVTALFVTWWDLGKSILSFWGGVFQFIFNLVVALLGILRMVALGVWAIVHDVLLMPAYMLKQMGQSVVRSPIPWIAVALTLSWCLVETTIFTYVMSPLVIDTFSNITGETMSEAFVRLPLFLFLFFVVLGSYAVLSTFVDSFKTKRVATIARIGAIEMVVLFVEVVFLYREFVDSLVPWFAQYSENFELGVFWTLAIAGFVWFGVRSLSWFLFASHGTPTIMAVIQGRGLKTNSRGKPVESHVLEISGEYWERIKKESVWMKEKGEDLIAAFLLPPLQVIAAGLNFCTLCVINQHLFRLPFKDIDAIKYSEDLIRSIRRESELLRSEPAKRQNSPKVKSQEPEPIVDNIPTAAPVEDDPFVINASRQSKPSLEDV
ncbi:MAG: hypothetical protein GTO29_13445 [Candidatus Latescibacteria bacterium]|nr:hypothetical protein [Candidatus Latescibacterota bacterium]NIO57256.1 hypothetical protein [Candidatus Latescibacterota bacterium]